MRDPAYHIAFSMSQGSGEQFRSMEVHICDLCGSLLLAGYQNDHTKWHQDISDRADRYVPPPTYFGIRMTY